MGDLQTEVGYLEAACGHAIVELAPRTDFFVTTASGASSNVLNAEVRTCRTMPIAIF